jgi:S1-C subfamily serine protease
MMKTLLCLLLLAASVASGQVGVVVCGTNFGTGFVTSSNFSVITCSHVVQFSTNITFTAAGSNVGIKLKVVKEFESADIAVLGPVVPTVTTYFMKLGSYEKSVAGESITMVGEDNRVSENASHFDVVEYSGLVVIKGKASFNKVDGDILEIYPFGRPTHKPVLYPVRGYSGSPVLNERDEVIGILSQIYWTVALNNENGPMIPRIWAVSIDPIKPFVK